MGSTGLPEFSLDETLHRMASEGHRHGCAVIRSSGMATEEPVSVTATTVEFRSYQDSGGIRMTEATVCGRPAWVALVACRSAYALLADFPSASITPVAQNRPCEDGSDAGDATDGGTCRVVVATHVTSEERSSVEAALDGTVTGEWLSGMFCGGHTRETSAKFVRDDSPDGTWPYAHVAIGELLCHMESMELASSVPADGTLMVPFECMDGTTQLLPMARMEPPAYATDDFQDASFCVDLQRLPDVMDDIGRYVTEIGNGYLREADRRELRQRSLSRIFVVANRIWDPRCSSWSDWVAYVSLSPWYNPRRYSLATWPVIARPVHGDGLADILGRLGVLSSRILVNTFLRPGRNGYEWCPETQSWVDAQDLRPWWKSPEEYDADLMDEGLWEDYWMARSYDEGSWRPSETEVSYREERAERASQLFGRYEDAYDDGL